MSRIPSHIARYVLITLFAFHVVRGCASANGSASDDVLSEASVAALLGKANAWQLAHPWKSTDRNWIRATYYTGVMAAYGATGDEAYLKQALAWSEENRWRPGDERAGGNVLTCGQTYLELYFLKTNRAFIEPLVAWLNSGASNTPSGAKVWYLEGGRRYADSLYVGPPTLAMLAKATGDRRYLDWMNAFYWDVHGELFDRDAGLFYRDARFHDARTKNGKKVIWSRGNGWVFAGLPRILQVLPRDNPSYPRYVELFKTMAAALSQRQGRDGLWRPNLDDPDEFPLSESSGSGFFCSGFAWGIRNGFLERDSLSVVERAWLGLTRCVSRAGKVQWGQPVGDRPVSIAREDSHEYVTGTFLLAGSEVLQLVQNGTIRAAADTNRAKPVFDLAPIRREAGAYAEALLIPGQPYGSYRHPRDTNSTLYATCDVALMRVIMGENLHRTLTAAQRSEWISHINSFAREDGTYGPTLGTHAREHANGMVISALGPLGGRQKYPVRLYNRFDSVDAIEPWLEKMDWRNQWGGSHLFWGGLHCFSLSSRCTPAWREKVFQWLDHNIDPQTGWWRAGVAQRRPGIDGLGGGAHIWPIYQHHKHHFPRPEQVIDSILDMQMPDGSWLEYGGYLELDALYGLTYMGSLAPGHRREDLMRAARRHGQGLVERWPGFLDRKPNLHMLLAATGSFGLLNQLLPAEYVDSVRWTDIFSDPQLYLTRDVEVLYTQQPGTTDKQ